MLNPSQARVIDPILSNYARGYSHPERVGHFLFPTATVPVRGGKRLEFGKESFRLYNSRRSPGAATKRVQFGYAGSNYSLEQSSLEGLVPFEIMQEAERVPGLDMAQGAIQMVMNIISLEKEVDQATKAQNAANYDNNHKVTLAGSDQWSHVDSKPKDDIKAAKEAVRSTSGRYPNTMIIGPKVFNVLDDHPAIVEKFKYTSSESITVEMLAKYFDVERVVVGKSVYANDDDEFIDCWGDTATLAYVPMGDGNWQVPAYGYTYQLSGTPAAEEAYSERNAKSWIYPYTDEWSAELVGPDAGFLIQDIILDA